jgi:hypothetical protein
MTYIGSEPLPGLAGGTGVTNTGLTINLGSGSSGKVLTSDLSGNGTWQTISVLDITWNTITSATNPNPLAKNNGYIAAGVSPCIFSLPVSAAVGDTFIITGLSSLFTVTQNATQYIFLGIASSLAGIGGSITSTTVSDHVQIVCVQTNIAFKITDSIGNLIFI